MVLCFEARSVTRAARGGSPATADCEIHIVRHKGSLTTPADCEEHIVQYALACEAAVPEPHSLLFTPKRSDFVLATEKHLCAKQNVPLLTAYAERYAMSCGTNWAAAFLALYTALLDVEIEARAKEFRTIWVVRDSAMAGILAERLSGSEGTALAKTPALADLVAECAAYMLIGAPDRGFDCGRGATRIGPENMALAINSIEGVARGKWLVSRGQADLGDQAAMPGSLAAANPGQFKYKRCIAAVLACAPAKPGLALAHAFHLSTGELLGVREVPYVEALQPAKALGVYEACWPLGPGGEDQPVIVWDACSVGEMGCRREPYDLRIKAAAEYLATVMVPQAVMVAAPETRFAFEPLVRDERSGPFVADMLHEATGGLVFVHRDAPCDFYPGTMGAYVWRGPDMMEAPLAPGQAVLHHAYGWLYSTCSLNNCLLERIGTKHGAHIAENGKTYVCEWCPGDGTWRILREAKRKQPITPLADLAGGPAILVPDPAHCAQSAQGAQSAAAKSPAPASTHRMRTRAKAAAGTGAHRAPGNKILT